MANVNIPLVQTNDKNINQLQQNIIQGIQKALGDFLFSVNTYGTTIGEVKPAMLTLSQFQSQMGKGWVLCDGSACQNSKYSKLTGNNNVPDMRSCVLRMKDNGRSLNPDGDLSLGTYQSDNYAAHAHVMDAHGHSVNESPHSHAMKFASSGDNNNLWHRTVDNMLPASGDGTWRCSDYNNSIQGSTTGLSINGTTATMQNSGGNETRMKNITINYFIRIN